MSNWISVKDQPLPTEGKFLAFNAEGEQAVVWPEDGWYIRGGFYTLCEYGCGGNDDFDNITHWKPLDEPPQED